MKCPYCDQEISASVSICPHCLAQLSINNNIIAEKDNKLSTNKKKYIKYYIIISIFTISLLILVSLNILRFLPTREIPNDNNTKAKFTDNVTVIDSKNIGIYARKNNPSPIGNMIIAAIKDAKNNKITPVDVKLTRYLTDEEINLLIPTSNQELIEGFIFRGIEYEVYFNDLDYLHDATLNPVLKATLYDTHYLNDFFQLNGHYYKNEITNFYNGPNIKNNEMATIQAIYQVPINESYLICFGEDDSNLGCYNN